jgi:hypothetical protein
VNGYAPAGLVCLNDAALGKPVACRSSCTNCQAPSASSILIYPGRPLRTLSGAASPGVSRRAGVWCGLQPYLRAISIRVYLIHRYPISKRPHDAALAVRYRSTPGGGNPMGLVPRSVQINRALYCESRRSNGSLMCLRAFYWLTVVENNSYPPVWTTLLDIAYKRAYGRTPGTQIAAREKTWKKIPLILCDYSCLSSLSLSSNVISMLLRTDFVRKV